MSPSEKMSRTIANWADYVEYIPETVPEVPKSHQWTSLDQRDEHPWHAKLNQWTRALSHKGKEIHPDTYDLLFEFATVEHLMDQPGHSSIVR